MKRRLLREDITYSAAKERESNILHALGYWNQQNQYFQYLQSNSHIIEARVAHHLNLASSACCRVADPEDWLSGSFNVCIPVYLDNRRQSPSLLFRLPLPYRVGERYNSGNADEKILCEAGTYVWLQQNCPDIPIPRLFGYGLSTGQTFTALNNLPFFTRIFQRMRRQLLKFLGYPIPSSYIPHQNRSGSLTTGYLLIEYIDQTRGKMLSQSWENGRHNKQLRANLFRGLSSIMLTLANIPLPKIGSFILDEQGFLKLRNRPLTIEIQDLENDEIPVDIPRDFTYSTVDAYINDILRFHDNRLQHQLNAANSIQDCLFQMAALTTMRTVRPVFFRPGLNRGPFFMTLTDLHASNLFVDEDWNITCLVDLEWACSRPAEMIHPPYWLTGQPVDGISLDDYEAMHREFMETLLQKELEYPLKAELQFRSVLQEGWDKGTFWYSLALDSPTGLFRIFYEYIQPRFSGDHINEAAFFRIAMEYWCVNAAMFVQQKLKDKERYDQLLLKAFSA